MVFKISQRKQISGVAESTQFACILAREKNVPIKIAMSHLKIVWRHLLIVSVVYSVY